MELLIAENSTAAVNISIEPQAGCVIRFAANELAKYLKKISCADFSIVEEAQKRSNVIRLETKSSDEQNDSFELKANAEGLVCTGVNERSVLYGVYEFLEQLGCVFAEPGLESIPTLKELKINSLQKSYTAAFPLRNIFRIQKINIGKNGNYRGFEEHHLQQIDWMAKRKLNHYQFYVDYNRYDLWEKYKHLILDELLKRGFTLELTQHSIGYFCPADSGEDYNNFGSETYQTVHPEWYSGPRRVRMEAPEVQNIVSRRFIEFVRRNQELDIIALWPIDSEMAPPNDKSLSVADEYLSFWNKLAKTLAAEFPGKKLSCLAYFELLDPPKKTYGENNLHLWFCPVFAHSMYPMTDKRNRKYLNKLAGWVEKMPQRSVNVFGYYGWYPIFTPLIEKMVVDLNVYLKYGVEGVYGWCGFTYNLMGTGCRWARELNVFAELLWNPQCDIEGTVNRWASTVFGNAAEKVLDFYATIKEFYDKESQVGLGGGREQDAWISLPKVRRCLVLLDEARDKVDEQRIIERLDIMEATLEHAAVAKVPRTDPRDNFEDIYPF